MSIILDIQTFLGIQIQPQLKRNEIVSVNNNFFVRLCIKACAECIIQLAPEIAITLIYHLIFAFTKEQLD